MLEVELLIFRRTSAATFGLGWVTVEFVISDIAGFDAHASKVPWSFNGVTDR